MSNKINCLQTASMILMVVMSSFLGLSVSSIIRVAGVDAYLAPILGGTVGFLAMLLFLYIANYEPSLPISQKINKLFGKVGGFIINALLVGIFFTMGISGMFNLTNFIGSQFLSETPPFLIGILFSILIVIINMKGIETLSRVGTLLLTINIFLFMVLLLGLFPKIDFANFKPFLEFGIGKPLHSILYIIGLDVTPIFWVLMIPKNDIVNKEKYNKYMISFYILAFILAFFIMVITIGNLGIQLASIYQYPEYMVLKHISFFNFLDRIENIVTIQWIFGLFFSLSLAVYYVSNTIKYQNRSKLLPIIIVLSFLFASRYFFMNNTIFNNYSFKYAPIIRGFVLVIMILVGIMIFFKKRKSKTNNSIQIK